jgi:hypothetical protein
MDSRKNNGIWPGVSPRAEHSSDSPNEAIIPYQDGERSFTGPGLRSVQWNEKLLYPRLNRQKRERKKNGQTPGCNIEGRHRTSGKVFKNSTKLFVSLYELSPRANLRPQSESTATRTDRDVLVLI